MTDFLEIDGTVRCDAIAFADGSIDASTGQVSGVALHFNQPNKNGWIVPDGALISERLPSMLWSHDQAEVIGRWTSARQHDGALHVTGKLNLDVARARETLSLLKNGDVSGLSVGLSVDRKDVEKRGNQLVFHRARLDEVSVVALPADSDARVLAVADIRSAVAFKKWLHSNGWPRAAAEDLAFGGWPRLRPADETQIAQLETQISAARAELHTLRK